MTPEERALRGNEANNLLDNKILKSAFEDINLHLDDAIAGAKTTDSIECADVVRAKQLMIALKRTIERYATDGKVALKELELNRASPVRRFIQR